MWTANETVQAQKAHNRTSDGASSYYKVSGVLPPCVLPLTSGPCTDTTIFTIGITLYSNTKTTCGEKAREMTNKYDWKAAAAVKRLTRIMMCVMFVICLYARPPFIRQSCARQSRDSGREVTRQQRARNREVKNK